MLCPRDPIAIVGTACLLPQAEDVATFWEHLIAGRDLIVEANGEIPGSLIRAGKGRADHACSKMGGWRDFSVKEMSGFALPAEFLEKLDRPFRWTMEAGREALRDAGVWRESPETRSRCGLVLGGYSWSLTHESMKLLQPLYDAALEAGLRTHPDFAGLHLSGPPADSILPENAMLSGMVAGLAARALSLGGPHYAIDAACASALYCLKLAALHLWEGQCDLMLAGGISAFHPGFGLLGFSTLHAIPDGSRSRPFDRESDGLALAEGAAVFALKRLSDARRDGNTIHAVIRGIGLSNDGRGRHLLAPNARGQQRAYERAYAEAGLPIGEVDYLECHATGTAVGDKMELESLATLSGARALPLLGSVKSNMGHVLAAAGLASALKVIGGMRSGTIPATIGIREAATTADGFGGERIVRQNTAWPATDHPRRGAVNAFGFGGANAHLILEQPAAEPEPAVDGKPLVKEPLAIIGMDGIFGGDEGLTALRQRAMSGTSNAREVPPGRWRGLQPTAAGGPSVGGFAEAFEVDPLRYHLPPETIDLLNPAQILMLRVADGAIQDAGLEPGGRVGVIVAAAADPASHRLQMRWDLGEILDRALKDAGRVLEADARESLLAVLRDSIHPPSQSDDFPGYIGNLLASRIAALWDFHGPVFTLSAEENSVFRALELAQLLLASGEADAMVIGAVDLGGSAENCLLRRLQTSQEPGLCGLALGREEISWSVGEGSGAIVVQRVATAREEGRRIRARVESVAVASGSPEFHQASAEATLENALERACEAALTEAKMVARDIGCVEANASGLTEEDTAEARVLAQIFSGAGDGKVALGSAKAVWGHCYGAAGMAALLRASLGLENQSFFPTAGWTGPRQELMATRFFVPQRAQPWFVSRGARRVTAVTGLAHDRSAACVILSEEQPVATPPLRSTGVAALQIVAFAVADRSEAKTELSKLLDRLRGSESLESISRQSLERIAAAPESPLALCLVARSRDDLAREIKAAITYLGGPRGTKVWRTPAGSCLFEQPLGRSAPVTFVYPAIDTPYPGMMADLFQLFPQSMETLAASFRDPAAACAQAFLHPPTLAPLTPADREEIDAGLRGSPAAMLRAAITYSTVLTAGLRGAFGLEPGHAFGFSLGESTMLFALGIWTPNDEWMLRLEASAIFENYLGGRHACTREFLGLEPDAKLALSSHVLLTTAERVRKVLQDRRDVSLTQISTPEEVAIFGTEEGCREIIGALPCENFRTDLDFALHSAPAASFAGKLSEMLRAPVTPSRTQYHFSAGPAPEDWSPASIATLVSHGLVHSLDFPELVHRAYDAGARIFIEIGPRNTCSRRIGAILGAAPHETLAFDQQRGASARDSLARLLAALISQRVPVDLTAWLAMLPQTPANDARKRRVSLCGPSISEMVATKLRALPSLSSDEDFGHEPPVETRSPTVVLPIASSSRIGRGSAVGGALALWQHASRNRLHAHRSVLDQHLVRLRQRASPALQTREQKSVAPGVALYDEAAVMEFAEGRAARVFGKEYAAIDALPRRVRLPSPPFLAMSRVTALHAIPFRLEPCWIETEYDVPDPAWHGVDGYVPYMAADAQGVLFLLGYIGIDRHNQGQRMYRWLDAEMRFSGLALRAGQTVRYRIDIRSFVQHQETLLFFTDFSCRVDGDPFLEIRNCCAGFFSDEELSRGQGIRSGEMRRTASTAAGFQPLLRSEKESFSEEDLGRLQAGNAAACFGPNYGEMATGNPSLRLPPGPMRMIDRIRHAALPGLGGTRGEIVAEKDLDPGDWYLRTHFKDSPVFAGPCMMEGCFQLLQFYALYLGLAQRRAGLHFAPHGGIETKVRFRSQVPAEQSVFTIQMHVTTVSCEPCPAIVANFDLVHHGVTIGCIENLGIRLV